MALSEQGIFSNRAAAGKSEQWLSAMTVAAILFVLLLLAILLWFTDHNERASKRATLINDALWVEQSLHFVLLTDEGHVSQLAHDLSKGLSTEDVRPRIDLILRSNPEIRSIVWHDQQQPVLAMPEGSLLNASAEAQSSRQLAAQTGTAAYSGVFTMLAGKAFEITLPMPQGGGVTATISLDELMARHVPWWVAQKYQVLLVSATGEVLARKSPAESNDPASGYSIAFDPPGRGLMLHVVPFDTRTSLANNALLAAILVFSLLAVVSLLAMRSTMRKRTAAEAALREEHQFRKAMEDSLTVGMRARDLSGKIVYINPAFSRMTGFSAAELIGAKPPMPYWVQEDLERTLELHQMVLSGNAPPEGFEIRIQRKDGSRFDALIYEAPLIDAEGQHRGWMGSVVDITDRNQLERVARQQAEKLAQTSRLVTMGEMASTIAHELNQPLAAISSYAAASTKLVEQGKVDRQQLRTVFAKLSQQVQRAGDIIKRVREFVRQSGPDLTSFDVSDMVTAATEFMGPEIKAKAITLELSVQPGVKCIGDRVLLEQVLLNLVRNAVEAVAKVPRKNRRLAVVVEEAATDVVIQVADHGPGLSPSMREKLFQPFNSTKPEGMGIGLNICRSILELHRGRLWYEDRPQGGSIFSFSVPKLAT